MLTQKCETSNLHCNMKSIRKLFEVLQKKNIGHGAYVSLVGATKGRGCTRDTLSRNFTALIPKGEFANKDREALIDHLVERTNCVEEAEGFTKKKANNYYCEKD